MTSNAELRHNAHQAIGKLFEDSSVPAARTRLTLLEIAEYIQLCLNSLPKEPA